MYKITKEFSFSASHRLLGLPPDHPCARLHGHNYLVELELSGTTLNQFGFVRDYHDLNAFKKYLDEEIDHRHLNEVFGNDFITAEYLAQSFFTWCRAHWPEISAVRVSETPRTWAEYRP
jgi:6-pyruvoyltetrahydropterin/6-carboxytetrahydropterin synthase